jgi:hypothetical protein
MSDKETFREEVKEAGRIVGHGGALILGFVLMVVGMAMGVSLVLLPVGLPVGIAGFLLMLWALFTKRPAGAGSDRGLKL